MCDIDTLHEKILASITEANNKQTNEIKKYINEEILALKEIIDVENKKRTELEQKYEQLKNKCSYLEKQSRKNKIIIFGIDLEENSNLLEVAIGVINHYLGLDITRCEINNIYTVGKNAENKPVVIEFLSFLRKSEILKNCKKLKGTKISVSEVLSIEERKTNKILRLHLKQAKSKNLNAYIRKDKLYIDQEEYTVQDLVNIQENNEKCREPDDVSKNKLTRDVPNVSNLEEASDTDGAAAVDQMDEIRQEVKKYQTRSYNPNSTGTKTKRTEKDIQVLVRGPTSKKI